MVTEKLIGDAMVAIMYSSLREHAPSLFKALTSARVTRLLGLLNYDWSGMNRPADTLRLAARLGIELHECVEPPESLNTARRLFERRIRYWQTRPLAAEPDQVVSPVDARLLVGTLNDLGLLPVKGKFFDCQELLDVPAHTWSDCFADGDVAIFRLTPDKYHYNHAPVSGRVLDFYAIDGAFHACNPGAVVCAITPYSKNRRAVTIIDTDCVNGSGVGRVAMVEVAALMIGVIAQCYSHCAYHEPEPLRVGMWLEKGCPKSLYRPGSSTTILLFEKNRICFAPDLLVNQSRCDVQSRFSAGFGRSLVETNVQVRSPLARRV